jgi:hypothetical protein
LTAIVDLSFRAVDSTLRAGGYTLREVLRAIVLVDFAPPSSKSCRSYGATSIPS